MAAKKKARKAAKKTSKAAKPATPSIGGAFEMLDARKRKPDPDGPWKPGEGWAQSGGTGPGTWLKARRKI